jgi:hypothetical protein
MAHASARSARAVPSNARACPTAVRAVAVRKQELKLLGRRPAIIPDGSQSQITGPVQSVPRRAAIQFCGVRGRAHPANKSWAMRARGLRYARCTQAANVTISCHVQRACTLKRPVCGTGTARATGKPLHSSNHWRSFGTRAHCSAHCAASRGRPARATSHSNPLPAAVMAARMLLLSAAAAAAATRAAAALPVVQLDAWGTDSIRVRIAPSGSAIVDPPMMALLPNGSTAAGACAGQPAATCITSGNLQVAVNAANGFITATRLSDGMVVLAQTGLTFGAAAAGSRAGSVSVTVTFAGTAGERVYGLGEHAFPSVQMLPYSWNLQDSQWYQRSHGGDVVIPYYSSSRGYGFLWNMPSYGTFNLSNAALAFASNATMNADFWITTTPASFTNGTGVSPVALLLANDAGAVGQPAPLPFYATGFIQCKNRYRSQAQLLSVAQEYITRGLPVSVIVIDYLHWVTWGDWAFNPTCWPDPQGMVDQLATWGIELMVSYWPMLTPGGAHWAEFQSGGLIMGALNGTNASWIEDWDGDMYAYDATSAAARAAYFDAFWQGYGQYGIKSLWLDAGEWHCRVVVGLVCRQQW